MLNERTLYLFFFILISNSYSENPNSLSSKTHKSTLLLRDLSEEIISEKVGYRFKNRAYIEIGTPSQKLTMKLSTSFCGIWVHSGQFFKIGFNPKQSSSYTNSQGTVQMENVSGIVSHDKVIAFQHIINSMPFLIVDSDTKEDNENYQGMIGLGYRCIYNKHLNFDILQYIAQKNASLKNVFFVRFGTAGGYIELGDYPSKIDYDYKHYKKMDLIQKPQSNSSWSVKLDSVYFEDGNMISVKDNLSIGLGGSFISVKKEFFIKVKERYFNDYIEQGLCGFNEQNSVDEITCDPNSETKIGMISFIVGKWNFKIRGESLFVNLDRNGTLVKWFGMVHYSEFDEYYISQVLLKGRTIVYDKTKNEIGYFHSLS